MFQRPPRLVRLFLVHGSIGLALAAAFTALLIWFDVAHLGHLITSSPVGWLAAFMLVWFFAITFGGVQIAIRVMSMADQEPGPTGGHKVAADLQPVPVPVRVSSH